MNNIELLLKELLKTSDKEEQVKILQTINKSFLCQYMLRIDEDLRLYPIEVEAYYYNETNFPDKCVHQNDLQKDRFGQLYFHRASKSKDSSFLYDRGGFDICLSDSENYYLGILIRSAWINSEEIPVCGPGLLTRRVVKHICKDDSVTKITEIEKKAICELEENDSIIVDAIDDKRQKNSPIFNSTRCGISSKVHPEYGYYKLRSLIELECPSHPFKEKEKVVEIYMRDNKITPKEENVKQLLGYTSKTILEKLKK